MKLLIIGQSVEDHINFKNTKKVKPGGIHYSAAALVNIKEQEDEIYLCTSIEKNKEPLFYPVYDKVNSSMFNYTDQIPRVDLTIHDNKEREEQYSNLTGSLEINTDVLKDFDAVYINMITGFDITLSTLDKIREEFTGIIYIDIHTLSRGYDNNGKREFRNIPDAEKWLRSADIIQVNDTELYALSTKREENEIVNEVLDIGVKYLIVTLGMKGVRLFYRTEGETASIFISAIKINALNNVGCGDVFGAVYIYYYIKSISFIGALKKANIAAGLSALYTDTDQFKNMKNDVFTRYN
jgi:sugar/nucleoside kinase (ribokinase family)